MDMARDLHSVMSRILDRSDGERVAAPREALDHEFGRVGNGPADA
jgi:hypothetical protein